MDLIPATGERRIGMGDGAGEDGLDGVRSARSVGDGFAERYDVGRSRSPSSARSRSKILYHCVGRSSELTLTIELHFGDPVQ